MWPGWLVSLSPGGTPSGPARNELIEIGEPDGDDEQAGLVDGLVCTHCLSTAAEVGGGLLRGLLVAAGQQEVLTAGREVRRERAADGAGPDDG